MAGNSAAGNRGSFRRPDRRLVALVAVVVVLVGIGVLAIPRLLTSPVVVPLPRAEAAADALAELRSLSSTPVEARFEDGVATSVLATVKVEGATPDQKGLHFLASARDLYGLGRPEVGLSTRDVVTVGGELPDAAVFQQTFRGIPVLGAEVAVYSRGDAVLGTAGMLRPQLTVETDPTIGAGAAEEAALLGRPGARVAGDPDLVIFDPALFGGAGGGNGEVAASLPAALAWRVRIRTAEEAESVLVDASTAAILVRIPQELDAAIAISTLNNQTSARDSVFCGETAHEYLSPLNTEYVAAVKIFTRIHDFYATHFGRNGWDGDGIPTHVHLDTRILKDGEVEPKARFLLDCDVLEFSPGWISDGTTEYLGIAAHEFQHGVTRTRGAGGGFEGWWLPGALNESYGDVFAMFIMGDPILEKPGINKPNANRDLSNPNEENAPDRWSELYTPANYCGPDAEPCDREKLFPDSGWIHSNRGISNMAAYLLWAGGTHPDTGIEVKRVPLADLYRLYYNSLPLMPTHSDFWTQRTVLQLLAAAKPDQLCSVRNAFAAVEIGLADQDCNGILDPDDDPDGDGIPALEDNCPIDPNPVQYDQDGDGLGVPCDKDQDGDGVEEKPVTGVGDNCPLVANNSQEDLDQDGIGSACDAEGIDIDEDGINNADDNCILAWNPRQPDTDRDGEGDACDPDDDGDGVSTDRDNCPYVANGDQADRDGDKLGNLCDTCPATVDNGLGWTLITYIDPAGNMQSVYVPQVADSDGDGTADACDPDHDGDGASLRIESGSIRPSSADGTRADLVMSGDAGGMVTIDVPMCDGPCVAHPPADACTEARLAEVDPTTRVSVQDDLGTEVARALGDADAVLRWSPEPGRTYELALERLEGTSGEDRMSLTMAGCTLGDRDPASSGPTPAPSPVATPTAACGSQAGPETALLILQGPELDRCWVLDRGRDVSPTPDLVAAVWSDVQSDPSGAFADLVTVSLGGPVFDGTQRTSREGLILGFGVSRDTAQGTTTFDHVFNSSAGECEVTMERSAAGVVGTFACEAIADGDGHVFRASGSFDTRRS